MQTLYNILLIAVFADLALQVVRIIKITAADHPDDEEMRIW